MQPFVPGRRVWRSGSQRQWCKRQTCHHQRAVLQHLPIPKRVLKEKMRSHLSRGSCLFCTQGTAKLQERCMGHPWVCSQPGRTAWALHWQLASKLLGAVLGSWALEPVASDANFGQLGVRTELGSQTPSWCRTAGEPFRDRHALHIWYQRWCQRTQTCLPAWIPGHCLHGCPPILRTWSWRPWSLGEVLHPRLWVKPDACLVMPTFQQFAFN